MSAQKSIVHGKNNLEPKGQAIGFELDPTTSFWCILFTECSRGQEPRSSETGGRWRTGFWSDSVITTMVCNYQQLSLP